MNTMFWADKIAKEIVDSGKYKPYWVDDMFTPSGFAHIGSLRGPLVHDLVYRSLVHAGHKAVSTYIFNDFDPIDGLPEELTDRFSQYLGFPLRTVPSPEPEFSSFAHYFTSDFQNVLTSLGVGATFLSSWDLYHEGKFNGVIREALDQADHIQDIYQKVSGSKKRDKGWLPLQVICEQCHKLGTTRVHAWDGTSVTYTCEPDMVTWAKGCGHVGNISPFDGNGKLPWKVDWAAHWKVLGVTIEGAGKDHSSKGGSRDIARELCRDVFHISDPYNLPYEFFLIGGKKMSSSKGLGLKARDVTKLLPRQVGRFLFTRTDYRQAIEFDPMGTMAIPDLFDEFDRCWEAFRTGSDQTLARAFELSQIDTHPLGNPVFIPRFRDVVNVLQLPNVDLKDQFRKEKGSDLTPDEIAMLEEREKYAKVWIELYASDTYRFRMTPELPSEVSGLTTEQRQYLAFIIPLVESGADATNLQLKLYEAAKTLSFDSKKAFAAVYISILGKTYGPKAGWLLRSYPVEDIVLRLRQASETKEGVTSSVVITPISKPDYFTIDPGVGKVYPSVSIGIALIKNVTIGKSDPKLEKEKTELLSRISALTTEQIGQYPEVVSYRTLYKEMGVDWHSRRPSPEALLRRVALGKGQYSINTCVDAYNLVVLKHRVSVGAFDMDQVKTPTVLRFAGGGDSILLLGDDTPTVYSTKELAYYDKEGGYNIDFNYRDAQRTKVTQETKNIWINVDGVFSITPEQVQIALNESIALITKYCGGTVEFSGLVL